MVRQRRIDKATEPDDNLALAASGCIALIAVVKKAINWEVEVEALRDLSVTAGESHRIAAEALWDSIAAAPSRKDGVLEQKVLTAKLAAEMISALEDLGALALSIGNRVGAGILYEYLNYKPREVTQFYKRIQQGVPVRELLRLPEDEALQSFMGRPSTKTFVKGLDGLQSAMETAAVNYLALNGKLVVTYNKIKHGFVVVVRLGKLVPGKEPPTDWQQNVNILTGISANGSILYTDLERSPEMLESLMGVIKTCAQTWKELASLILFLWEQHVPLDMTQT